MRKMAVNSKRFMLHIMKTSIFLTLTKYHTPYLKKSSVPVLQIQNGGRVVNENIA